MDGRRIRRARHGGALGGCGKRPDVTRGASPGGRGSAAHTRSRGRGACRGGPSRGAPARPACGGRRPTRVAAGGSSAPCRAAWARRSLWTDGRPTSCGGASGPVRGGAAGTKAPCLVRQVVSPSAAPQDGDLAAVLSRSAGRRPPFRAASRFRPFRPPAAARPFRALHLFAAIDPHASHARLAGRGACVFRASLARRARRGGGPRPRVRASPGPYRMSHAVLLLALLRVRHALRRARPCAATGILQDWPRSAEASIGRERTRLPVAAKIALHTAGAIGGTATSPTPPGFSLLSTMCVATRGISFIRSGW